MVTNSQTCLTLHHQRKNNKKRSTELSRKLATAINNSKSFDTSQIASSVICRIAFSHPFEENDTLCKREQGRDQKEGMGGKRCQTKIKVLQQEKNIEFYNYLRLYLSVKLMETVKLRAKPERNTEEEEEKTEQTSFLNLTSAVI